MNYLNDSVFFPWIDSIKNERGYSIEKIWLLIAEIGQTLLLMCDYDYE